MIRNFLRQGFRVFDVNSPCSSRRRYFSSLKRSPNGVLTTKKNKINIFIMGCGDSKLYAVKPEDTINQESEQADEFVEGILCKVSDLEENKPKTFTLDEGKVLLIKQKGVISALGPKCTHNWAPLVSSAVGDGRLRCQWHGACFNILNGDIEDFPGLDSLPCHQVTILDNDEVKVRAKKSELESNLRVKPMVKKLKSVPKHFVVIGGGPAGAVCVEALRQEGFEGQLTFICKENYLPYNRVKVSKAMEFDVKTNEFRSDEFYQKHDIDVLKGIAAIGVDVKSKTISLSNGNTLKYDKVFIATGCKPRRLDIPGGDLNDVVVLKDFDDSDYTVKQLTEDKEVVVVGSSFIAMEAANYCLDKVKKVTVVLRRDLPFQPFLGPEIGAAFFELFKEKGVNFITRNELTKINVDEDGKIVTVDLKDGRIINANLVILGVGSGYYTDFLKGSGIDMRPDGSIETDEYLKTNDPDVFVGGDIAYAPVWSNHNEKDAIGHYPLAHYHGKIAALNMLDKNKKLEAVPYFWTVLFKKPVRYAGHGSYDDIIYAGDVKKLKFVAFYLNKDEVVAVSSCAMDPVVSQFAELLAQGKRLHRDDLKEDPLAWTKDY